MSIAFITHSECYKHNMGIIHPESPNRLSAIQDRLISSGVSDCLTYYNAPLAEEKHLLLAHSNQHIQNIKQKRPLTGINHIDADTAISPGTWNASLRAAGAGILAIDLVMQEKSAIAFCCIRPPGHHAEHNQAMGFCFFNNVAIAAKYASTHWKVNRIAIIDFDVHHGNGTEDIIKNDPSMRMYGFFQHPFYPYSGDETLAPNIFNIPMKAGMTGVQFQNMVTENWLDSLDAYAPEIIFISAGFDAHYEDDMASMGLIESDYIWVTKKILELAKNHAQGRIISMLEGGYNLSALSRSVTEHIRTLID